MKLWKTDVIWLSPICKMVVNRKVRIWCNTNLVRSYYTFNWVFQMPVSKVKGKPLDRPYVSGKLCSSVLELCILQASFSIDLPRLLPLHYTQTDWWLHFVIPRNVVWSKSCGGTIQARELRIRKLAVALIRTVGQTDWPFTFSSFSH